MFSGKYCLRLSTVDVVGWSIVWQAAPQARGFTMFFVGERWFHRARTYNRVAGLELRVDTLIWNATVSFCFSKTRISACTIKLLVCSVRQSLCYTTYSNPTLSQSLQHPSWVQKWSVSKEIVAFQIILACFCVQLLSFYIHPKKLHGLFSELAQCSLWWSGRFVCECATKCEIRFLQ